MRRRLILKYSRSYFQTHEMPLVFISGFSQSFPWVSLSLGQIAYVLLTRSPLGTRRYLARLACIRHAASVHPEPGSNSQNLFLVFRLRFVFVASFIVCYLVFFRFFFLF